MTIPWGNHSPAPHFRPIRPPHIAKYSSEACLTEPGALDATAKDGTVGAKMAQERQITDPGYTIF